MALMCKFTILVKSIEEKNIVSFRHWGTQRDGASVHISEKNNMET